MVATRCFQTSSAASGYIIDTSFTESVRYTLVSDSSFNAHNWLGVTQYYFLSSTGRTLLDFLSTTYETANDRKLICDTFSSLFSAVILFAISVLFMENSLLCLAIII